MPVNKRHKFGREYNIPRRVDIVLGLICSILENINTLPLGHAEMRDYCPMRCGRVTHFCVFVRDVLHMRLSLGLAHLSLQGYRQLDAGCLGVKLQTNRPVLTPCF